MELFFDSGATKCDCILLEQGRYVRHHTGKGINASYTDDATIESILQHFKKELPSTTFTELVFSGAGCGNEKNASRVRSLLQQHFTADSITVESDLAGACRLMGSGETCLVAILGTGAAACLYDGEKIIRQTPSLGWMLGDEGSGTHLGKMLITKYLEEDLSPNIRQMLEEEFSLDRPTILQKIYREPAPNLFFASFGPFLEKNAGDDDINRLLTNAFRLFFYKQILPLRLPDGLEKEYPLHIMGSIGSHFQTQITNAAALNAQSQITFAESPLSILKSRI